MEALALPGGLEPVWAAVPAIVKGTCSDDLPLPVPLTGDERYSRIKAGGRLRRLRPVTPPRSAGRDNGLREVQQVAGNGVKNGRVISLSGQYPEALLSQGKNRGQSGDCPGFPERRTSLCSDIPSKIAALETIGPPPKIGHADKKLDRKGQECTHTRNGCEQSKHTSHPDIKRTRRSRSWDTHLTRRCVAGIGNIRKVEICTGISSGRLCIHRSKRRRRWPTIMPMGATIRKPLRPWDMSTGIVCGNGCWKRGRRRDRLVCRGEMS